MNSKKQAQWLIILLIGLWACYQMDMVYLPQTRHDWIILGLFELVGFIIIGLFILWAKWRNERWWNHMETCVIPQHQALINRKRQLDENNG